MIPASILTAWLYPPGGAFLIAAILGSIPVLLLVRWWRSRQRSDLFTLFAETLNLAAGAWILSATLHLTPAIWTAIPFGALAAIPLALLLVKRLNLFSNETPA